MSITEGLSATLSEWLQRGRVDVGLLYNAAASPAVEILPLAEEQLCLIGPPRKRPAARSLPLRELPRYPLLIPSRPNAIRMLVESRLAALSLRPQVAMEIDAVPAILELVAEGHGYAVLSPRALGRAESPRPCRRRRSPGRDWSARSRSQRQRSGHRRRSSRRRSH